MNLVVMQNRTAVTSSLLVDESFEKEHKHVMESMKNLTIDKSEVKKYDLWWLSKNKEWILISDSPVEYADVIKNLKSQTKLTLKSKIKPSLFKIAERGNTSWMQHVPKHLLEKVNR